MGTCLSGPALANPTDVRSTFSVPVSRLPPPPGVIEPVILRVQSSDVSTEPRSKSPHTLWTMHAQPNIPASVAVVHIAVSVVLGLVGEVARVPTRRAHIAVAQSMAIVNIARLATRCAGARLSVGPGVFAAVYLAALERVGADVALPACNPAPHSAPLLALATHEREALACMQLAEPPASPERIGVWVRRTVCDHARPTAAGHTGATDEVQGLKCV